MFFWDILTLVDAFKGFKKPARNVIIVEWGGGSVNNFLRGSCRKNITVKAEKEFRISQGQIALTVFSVVEVRDMRG